MVRGLLAFLLILLGIHVGYTFASPVVKNRMLEGKMKDIAKRPGMRKEVEIRRDVLAFANEKGIPLPAENLAVREVNGHYVIGARYRTAVKVLFLERDYEFTPATHPSVAGVRRR
jgi:hypothetical protein